VGKKTRNNSQFSHYFGSLQPYSFCAQFGGQMD